MRFMGKISLENVVASALIGHSIDLENVHENLEGSEFDTNKFPALLYHQKNPRCLVILFGNGKLLCTGLGSIEDTKNTILKMINLLKSYGEKVVDTVNIEVESMIASVELGRELDIDLIHRSGRLSNVEMATGKVNALIYRPPLEEVTCLFFPGGKLAFSGAKSINQIERIMEDIQCKIDMVL